MGLPSGVEQAGCFVRFVANHPQAPHTFHPG